MSITNSILKLLNIKDSNLIFNENFIDKRKIKGKSCLIFSGYLKNNFEFCPLCGRINKNTIIKRGTRKSLIKINIHAELLSYLDLTKQRYKCKNCNKKFYATITEVDYRCHISKQVKLTVLNLAKKTISTSLISKMNNVCDNTVQSIFDTVFYNDTVYKNFLPNAICMDEFTFKKKTYAFYICNAKNDKTIDLVLNRTTNNLDKYFSHCTEKTRKRVKFVVMDMYNPYIDLIKKWFSNAKIIIDLFHCCSFINKKFK